MFLVFDVGGTTTRMAVSKTGDAIDGVKLFPTNHDFLRAMEEMRKVGEELSGGEKFHAVVGGIRSYNRKTGMLYSRPNFPLWINAPVLSKMKEMWGDVYLENDAALDALGEAVFGAGKGSRIVAYVTLSTGIGGCRITNGRIDESVYSFEPGNMLLPVPNGVDYFEKIASGSVLKEKYGKLVQDLDDEAAWDEIIENVSRGLNNVIVMWSPDIVILGGSVPQKMNFEKVSKKLKEYCHIYPEVPEVKLASIDEQGGLYGALAFLQKLP